MIQNLPDWILPNMKPSFNDLESATAIEMVYKLYGKNKELITDYQKFVEDIKNEVNSFKTSTNQDMEYFKKNIVKICNDYINKMDIKINCQDRKIADAIRFMKDNLINTIKELNENDELDKMILSAVSNLEEVLTKEQKDLEIELKSNQKNYEEKLDTRQTNYENKIDSQVRSLANGTPLVASSISGMTDKTKVYVNTSDGNWYYHNGTEWVSGGTYQSMVLGEDSVSSKNIKSTLKDTLKIRIPAYEELSGYRSNNGVVIENSAFVYTSPIVLKPFEKIKLKACGYATNVAMITNIKEDETILKVVALSIDSAIHDYEYINNSNQEEYISLSYKKDTIEDVFIETSDFKIKKEIASFSNLINEECQDKLAFRTNVTLVDNDDKLYKKVLHIDVEAGEVSYGYSHYYFKRIPTSEFKNVNNFVAFIDIKGQAPTNNGLMFRVGANTGGGFSGLDLQQKKIIPSNEKFTRYFIEVNGITQDLTELSNLTIGIVNLLNNSEELSYDIRAMGILINTTIEDATNDFLTLKDKSTIYTKSQEKEIEKDLFSSFIKFGVIGDSLASGEAVAIVDGVTKYIDNYDYSWGQFMARKYGMSCVNFSKGGMTTRAWLTDGVGLTKLQQEENKCNSYIIALGVNDSGHLGSDYLGTASDINVNDSSQNSDTFFGNYGKIISSIKAVQPKAKIFLFTMPSHTTDEAYTDYNNAIRIIATMFDNTYLIDLAKDYKEYYNSGFIKSNLRVGHYNAVGYNYMSELLFRILSDYMNNNIDEFKQIEFIGTDYSY